MSNLATYHAEQDADAAAWGRIMGGDTLFKSLPVGARFHFPNFPKDVMTKMASGYKDSHGASWKTGQRTTVKAL